MIGQTSYQIPVSRHEFILTCIEIFTEKNFLDLNKVKRGVNIERRVSKLIEFFIIELSNRAILDRFAYNTSLLY